MMNYSFWNLFPQKLFKVDFLKLILYTNNGSHRYEYDEFAQNNKVKRSFETLNPRADFSFSVKYVRVGIFFQFKSV